jgi:hypothetical protein
MRTGLAGVALICVMSIFLFPVGNGPFSATHGPATAFRAKRATVLLSLRLFVAAILTVACAWLFRLCPVALATLPDASAARVSKLPALTCVLLC